MRDDPIPLKLRLLRVLVIRHDLQVAEWEAIVRRIVKGYQQVGFFLIKLSKAFTTASLFGEEVVKVK